MAIVVPGPLAGGRFDGLEMEIPAAVLGLTPQITIVAALQDFYSGKLTLTIGPAGQQSTDRPLAAAGWPVDVGYGTATPLVSGLPFTIPAVPAAAGNSLYVQNTSEGFSGGAPDVVISRMIWVYSPVLTGAVSGTRTSFGGPQSY